MCEQVGGGGGGGGGGRRQRGSAQPKTRTPHKDVGKNAAILRDFLNSCELKIESKTKEFCETSSMFQVDNIKNEATLRDFLQ